MTKPKNRIYCPAIERPKMLFESREKAERFIKFNESELREKGNVKFEHLRAYYCIPCGGWHITHALLDKNEIKKRDLQVETIINKANEDIERKKKENDKKLQDAYDFIIGFDLKLFGNKKNFKQFLKDNSKLIPRNIESSKIYHIVKEIPIEYFTGERDLKKERLELSEEDIKKQATDLYSELPLSKLTSLKMIEEYIKWEFIYKRSISFLIIKELNKLCGLK